MEPKKYDYIDALRGLAILLVLLVHTGIQGGDLHFLPDKLAKFFNNGQMGVQLFFMVSAYTLMLSYDSRKNDTGFIKRFFVRRFFRIAPLYYLALITYICLFYVSFQSGNTIKTIHQLPVAALISNIFFVHGFSPGWINSYVPGGWSIAVEMLFYLILPLIWKYIKNINQSFIFLVASVFLSSLLNYLLRGSELEHAGFLYFYFPAQLPVFALGIFAYFTVKEGFAALNNTSLILFALTVLVYTYINPLQHVIYSLLFFVLIILLQKRSYNLIVNPATVFIGKISYSIYLTHFAVMHFMRQLNIMEFFTVTDLNSALANLGVRYLVILSFSCIISFITYKLIELPFQSIGKKLINRFK